MLAPDETEVECRQASARRSPRNAVQYSKGREIVDDGEAQAITTPAFRPETTGGFVYIPAEPRTQPTPPAESKRKLEHTLPAAVALIGELTAIQIKAGLRHNARRNDAYQQQISLFVWHVGLSGSPDSLKDLLQDLRKDKLLAPNARVLLFGQQFQLEDRRGGSTSSQREGKDAMETATRAVKARQPNHV